MFMQSEQSTLATVKAGRSVPKKPYMSGTLFKVELFCAPSNMVLTVIMCSTSMLVSITAVSTYGQGAYMAWADGASN